MNSQNNSPIIPGGKMPLVSTSVLEEIQPITQVIYDALERAILDSKSFFPVGKPVDVFLFPNLVRYHALELLENAPTEIDALRIDRLANNGIFVHFKNYKIRIWKADEGELPAPGSSGSKLTFYEQPMLFPEMRFMKLAIIWDTTPGGALTKLMLVCPNGDGNPNAVGQAHWQIEIPHPAMQIKPAATFGPSEDDLILNKSPMKKPLAKND